MTQAELLATQLADTRDWTNLLLADLAGDDWTFQPGPGLAHVLWTVGHLASAQQTLIHTRVLGSEVLPPEFKAHFPIGEAVKSREEHDYPSVEDVLAVFADCHVRSLAAVRGMSDELLAQPAFGKDGKTPHPHYRDKAGAVSHCCRHEAFHAGQIALIRRLLGKPFLR